jgi:hypothetical protein
VPGPCSSITVPAVREPATADARVPTVPVLGTKQELRVLPLRRLRGRGWDSRSAVAGGPEKAGNAYTKIVSGVRCPAREITWSRFPGVRTPYREIRVSFAVT